MESDFHAALIKAVPLKIDDIFTDNGIQFRIPPRYANGLTAIYLIHLIAQQCNENGVEQRFTKIDHLWTKGQVERMTRTFKEAIIKRDRDNDHDRPRLQLSDFVDDYNFGRRLKTIKGLMLHENICKYWISEPKRLKSNPHRQMPGLKTLLATIPMLSDTALVDERALGNSDPVFG